VGSRLVAVLVGTLIGVVIVIVVLSAFPSVQAYLPTNRSLDARLCDDALARRRQAEAARSQNIGSSAARTAYNRANGDVDHYCR
jgi:uncharacterized membrane protein YccC